MFLSDVAIQERFVPELVRRLEAAHCDATAHKLERALGVRNLHLVLEPSDRDAILRVTEDTTPEFAELRAALLRDRRR